MVEDQAQNEDISTDGLAGTALIVLKAIRNRRNLFWDATKDVRAEISKDAQRLVEVKPPERLEELKIPKATEEVEEALKAIQEKNNIIIAMHLGVTASMLEDIIEHDRLEVALALSAEAKGALSAANRGNLYGFYQIMSTREMRTDPSFDAAKRAKERFPIKSFHQAKRAEKPSKSGFFQQNQSEKAGRNGLLFAVSSKLEVKKEVKEPLHRINNEQLRALKENYSIMWRSKMGKIMGKLGLAYITKGLQIPWASSQPPSGTGPKTCTCTKKKRLRCRKSQWKNYKSEYSYKQTQNFELLLWFIVYWTICARMEPSSFPNNKCQVHGSQTRHSSHQTVHRIRLN
ncbi:MAG: hypothetical protein EZS28_023165 [Streblomastix strix]|uniref:Uncharacterized protein n=1 Tax=Streblomastix strix TaxID=222440 RepID=A0A5J4VFF9_9EUKA|nr:MAG: hypothetical protein EZS28_023165 [Streblomastix strix]